MNKVVWSPVSPALEAQALLGDRNATILFNYPETIGHQAHPLDRSDAHLNLKFDLNCLAIVPTRYHLGESAAILQRSADIVLEAVLQEIEDPNECGLSCPIRACQHGQKKRTAKKMSLTVTASRAIQRRSIFDAFLPDWATQKPGFKRRPFRFRDLCSQH